jgi:hypothetical protein
MLFQNFCDATGRVRVIPVADPMAVPPGAVFMRGIAFHPTLNAVYCNIVGLSPAPPPVVETFPYPNGELQTVSGGNWQRRSGGTGGYQVLDNTLLGNGAGDTYYTHQVSPDYAGKVQYIEAKWTVTRSYQMLGVNGSGFGAATQGYALIAPATFGSPMEWGYVNPGITSLGTVGNPVSAGDRLGILYDPAQPGKVEYFLNGVTQGIKTMPAPANTFPQGGIPFLGGYSGPADSIISEVAIRSTVIDLPAPAPPPPFLNADDVFIMGLRVSPVGIVYAHVAGPGVQLAPGAVLCDADGVIIAKNINRDVVLAGVGMLNDGTVTGFDASNTPLTPFSSGFSVGFGNGP